MIPQEATIFPKLIKLDDYSAFAEDNLLRILETSNLLVGSGARTSHAVTLTTPRLSSSRRPFTSSMKNTS